MRTEISSIQRVPVYFNEQGYKLNLDALENNLKQLNSGVELSIKITDGIITDFDLDAVNIYLKNIMDMPNLDVVSDLINQKENYSKLKELHSKKDSLKSDFITFDGNRYKLKDSALEDLKQVHTDYLKEEVIDAYNKLKKAQDILNELSNEVTNSLKKDFYGTYYINLIQLNNFH